MKRQNYFTMALGLLALIWLAGCTVVTTAEATAIAQGGAFDAETFAAAKWPEVVTAIEDNSVELADVLSAIQIDSNGLAKKDNLSQVASEFGLTTVGEAHGFMVKGSGVVTAVDTEARAGTMTVEVAGYDGPIVVKLYLGPRMPSDETAVRDAVGFIHFGDFKEQTEYGKVSRELNKRVLDEVVGGLDTENLVGQSISFNGVFLIRTFNEPGDINVSEIVITPVQLTVGG
ncbi:MAG TPA: DUF2291 domain-containing protein [Anaerolineae bacterium]|nr:DUF2291 domain-containing protein [Anaerolineae bacterium]HRV95473.1 DUF2291 domain-containing protein [Anaerolineae bacterium]